MNPYKIIVAYDGTDYHGWQEQAFNISTIAGVMQNRFQKVFGHAIKVVGASRTDAGVHASGQVARFYTDLELSPEIMQRAWNGALPPAIHIRSLEPICKNNEEHLFHPQHDVKEKTYQYFFSLKRPFPFFARYCHFHAHALDVDKMRDCLQLFIGQHNFRSFCIERCIDNTICTIDTISVNYYARYEMWCVTVKGKRFLHHMIRRVVGSALYISSHKDLSKELIMHALQKPAVYNYLPTAPAHGLLLRKIVYEERE